MSASWRLVWHGIRQRSGPCLQIYTYKCTSAGFVFSVAAPGLWAIAAHPHAATSCFWIATHQRPLIWWYLPPWPSWGCNCADNSSTSPATAPTCYVAKPLHGPVHTRKIPWHTCSSCSSSSLACLSAGRGSLPHAWAAMLSLIHSVQAESHRFLPSLTDPNGSRCKRSSEHSSWPWCPPSSLLSRVMQTPSWHCCRCLELALCGPLGLQY